MKIELNGIELDKDEESGEGRSIKNITTEDARNTEAYDAPGTQGSSYNDQGRSAVRLAFEGTVAGKEARTLMEGIWSCFKKGDPVDFNSDISGAADITKVLIESFVVRGVAGEKNRYDYAIGLWEYKEPPEEPDIPGTVSEEGNDTGESAEREVEARQWGENVSEDTIESDNELSGTILDENGDPAAGLTIIITGCGTEIQLTTDEDGMYMVEDLKPGAYTITVKSEDYDGIEETVFIGK